MEESTIQKALECKDLIDLFNFTERVSVDITFWKEILKRKFNFEPVIEKETEKDYIDLIILSYLEDEDFSIILSDEILVEILDAIEQPIREIEREAESEICTWTPNSFYFWLDTFKVRAKTIEYAALLLLKESESFFKKVASKLYGSIPDTIEAHSQCDYMSSLLKLNKRLDKPYPLLTRKLEDLEKTFERNKSLCYYDDLTRYLPAFQELISDGDNYPGKDIPLLIPVVE